MERLVYDTEFAINDLNAFAVVHCNLNILQKLFSISSDELLVIKDTIDTTIEDTENIDIEECDCLFFIYQTIFNNRWCVKVITSSKNSNIENSLYENIVYFCDEFFNGENQTDYFKEKVRSLSNIKEFNKLDNLEIKPFKLFK